MTEFIDNLPFKAFVGMCLLFLAGALNPKEFWRIIFLVALVIFIIERIW